MDIFSILRISQDGVVADVEELIGKLYISEEPSGLVVYVPKDKKAQELCFCDLLPKHLLDWLMRDPATQISDNIGSDAVTVISMVLSIDPSAIDLILEGQGIIEIDVPNEDPGIDVDGIDDQITPQRSRSQVRSAAEVPLVSPDIITLSPHLNLRPSGASSVALELPTEDSLSESWLISRGRPYAQTTFAFMHLWHGCCQSHQTFNQRQ
ncbi:hypothetical protein KXW58_004423 [Aspergillus fumigatus]|nr:hypothetical protein KXW58_004423 [Aspergillus fumigatus]